MPLERLLVGEDLLFPAPAVGADAPGAAQTTDVEVTAIAAFAGRITGEPEGFDPMGMLE